MAVSLVAIWLCINGAQRTGCGSRVSSSALGVIHGGVMRRSVILSICVSLGEVITGKGSRGAVTACRWCSVRGRGSRGLMVAMQRLLDLGSETHGRRYVRSVRGRLVSDEFGQFVLVCYYEQRWL